MLLLYIPLVNTKGFILDRLCVVFLYHFGYRLNHVNLHLYLVYHELMWGVHAPRVLGARTPRGSEIAGGS